MYALNIHNMPKIFWGAWPLITLERPKCSKVLVPLSKLSVSKNVWFTNARLRPLDFIHSEMLKGGMGGVRPLWKTASGVYYFRGWTPKGYYLGQTSQGEKLPRHDQTEMLIHKYPQDVVWASSLPLYTWLTLVGSFFQSWFTLDKLAK